jgi:hypothetical protein
MTFKTIYNQISVLCAKIDLLKTWRDEHKQELSAAQLWNVNDSIARLCDAVVILQKTFNA